MHDTQIDDEVLVPIAYFGCPSYIRRAVDSVLGQTHRNIRVVVINDGDPTPPWPMLADIEDPRLWRVDLTTNEGYYFAMEAARRCARSPFFLVQDADDWSEPARISQLLKMLEATNASAACSGQAVHYFRGPDHLPDSLPRVVRHEEFSNRVAREPRDVLRFRCMHHGLFRTEFLRGIGGYYGGFRVSYDTLVVGLAHLLGELTYTSEVLYNRVCRQGSLTTEPKTGLGSSYRRQVNSKLAEVYAAVRTARAEGLCGESQIGAIVHQFTEVRDESRLSSCADQLRQFMESPSREVGVIEAQHRFGSTEV